MNELDKRLLNDFQRDFPLSSRPYAELAERLGTSEAEALETLACLQEKGMVSRVGPVFTPGRVGASTLAAMAVPPERLEAVAALVSGYPEVNHNYEREHRFNLWFVVTAPDRIHLDAVLRAIEQHTGYRVYNLPKREELFVGLHFRV